MQKLDKLRLRVAVVAALGALCGLIGCGQPESASSRADAGTSAAPSSSATAGPIATHAELKDYLNEADQLLREGCGDEVVTYEPCLTKAKAAAQRLGELLSRLPIEYPKTRSVTSAAVDDLSDLDSWREACDDAKSGGLGSVCEIYRDRTEVTMDIENAWNEEH
jgi:hypothetical protein